MAVRLISAAEADLVSALDWYELRAPGSARLFLDDFEALISRLEVNPRQFPVVLDDMRRAALRRFPYSLFFRIEDRETLVVACLHASRNPSVWQRRN